MKFDKRRIIHCFMWKHQDIIKNIKEIKDQGFTSILISSVQRLKCDFDESPWYFTYQPLGFEKIGNRFGSEEDLKELCKVAKDNGLEVLVDVVSVNIANAGGGDLEHALHYQVDKLLVEDKTLFREPCRVQNWHDRNEVVNKTIGMPSLNFYNPKTQDIIIDFLNRLIDLGVGGFRMDSMKSIPTVQEGCDFLHKLKDLQNDKDIFIMGEVIFSPSEVIEMYTPYIHVLTEGNTWDKDKLVTFPLSHDTDYEFGMTQGMSDDMIINEYCLLNENYKNTMLYLRPYCNYWKDHRVRNSNKNY